MRMTHGDYLAILSFYNKDTSKLSKIAVRRTAEKILAEKLCRCIKKVKKNDEKKNEPRAIAICVDSVLKKKKLRTHGFTCKKQPRLLGSKNKSNKRGTSKKLSKIKGGRKTRKC